MSGKRVVFVAFAIEARSKGDEDKAQHLVSAASQAGVRHLVYISVVGADAIPLASGIDRAMFGYFGSKLAAERAVAESGRVERRGARENGDRREKARGSARDPHQKQPVGAGPPAKSALMRKKTSLTSTTPSPFASAAAVGGGPPAKR